VLTNPAGNTVLQISDSRNYFRVSSFWTQNTKGPNQGQDWAEHLIIDKEQIDIQTNLNYGTSAIVSIGNSDTQINLLGNRFDIANPSSSTD
jgi:hypothetical protein